MQGTNISVSCPSRHPTSVLCPPPPTYTRLPVRLATLRHRFVGHLPNATYLFIQLIINTNVAFWCPPQVSDLQATIAAVPCDAVLVGTPHDLTHVLTINHPVVSVTYGVVPIQNGGPACTNGSAGGVTAGGADGVADGADGFGADGHAGGGVAGSGDLEGRLACFIREHVH